ncbi:PRD domain-containing protein [Shouchella miscanthi]|uniref:PRD domain-containing protein n=1 Tax=Shouchella miscanthi TaxID=2598861 RepID=A0ABU6NJV1_9BACI|nr:PRD domain-containing protein [Shouchella miscanthi]MED4128486.1 PRD domain-containing protein [Shouchella miscanthi]
MVLKSRNTMVVSAVLFLIVVILLRFAGGLFEDNIAMFIGSIFGGNAESVPLIDFSSINLSWLNPSEWSMGDAMSSINAWLHDMIDSVLPAMINMFYYFVNGQQENKTKMEETLKMTELINRVIELVQYHFQIKLDEDSLNYTRFVTHLRYFLIRQMKQDALEQEEVDKTLLELVKTKYEKAYQAVEKIAKLLETKYGWTLSSNERLYLTLHVWRVTKR